MITEFNLGHAKVWLAELDQVFAIPCASAWLDKNDLSRVDGLNLQADRQRFRAGRILARYALSQLSDTGAKPADWTFRNDAYGKPRIDPTRSDLNFSISHAGICVAVAAGRGISLGIDIEAVESAFKIGIVPDVLTSSEYAQLAELPPLAQALRFVELWTLKEASAKAISVKIENWNEIDASDANNIRLNGRLLGAKSWKSVINCKAQQYQLSMVALPVQANVPTHAACGMSRNKKAGDQDRQLNASYLGSFGRRVRQKFTTIFDPTYPPSP